MAGVVNFLGYEFPELKPLKDVEVVGKTQYGLIIIAHPDGNYSEQYGKPISWVRPKDLENFEHEK